MNITEIIKDAFLFPSKNTGRFAIYLLLSVFIVLFASGGILTYAFGFINSDNYLIGGVYLIISMIIGFLIAGYHIKIIKSGIELNEDVPVFEMFKDFMTGFDNFIVLIFYFLIPTLIVALVGLDTDIFGKAITVLQEFVLQTYNVYILGDSVNIAANVISHALGDLIKSLTITIAVALVLFVIFSILHGMAEARLANTGSLKKALNLFESLKDMKKIGVVKVIIVILAFLIIVAIIETSLLVILNYSPTVFLLTTFQIIIAPYLVLVFRRALGLLYSDIA